MPMTKHVRPGGSGLTPSCWRTAAALALALSGAGCRDGTGGTAPEVVPAGPPAALALLASDGRVYPSPVEFFVTLPQRWPARAVLVDSAGRAVGPPIAARWRSSDSTVVRVGAPVGTTTELTGLRVGEARVTATYVLGADTLQLANVWHIQR